MPELSIQKPHSAKYRIENVVASVNFKNNIDLNLIAAKYHDVDFNVNKFPGLCIRLSTPKTTILMFNNGKMILTGLKNFKDVTPAIEKIRAKLEIIGIALDPNPEIKLVNMVISMDINQTLNLDQIALILPNCIYEPEVFPGIIMRLFDPITSVFLIFSSGRIILTGIKSENDIIPVIKSFGALLREKKLLK